ncbi:sensor histidine kinase [Marinobacter goseongensis]|uniref:sensor histidine kinase n=1 Tax=Marinobacter goseongensis TaxID=453838 RepID=UPI0020031B81|nr:ATP-binding protein [Marinobacter goseongensis]MCK7552704.1 ATP-binding protein [Marinobacter goseongensis]
MPLKTTRFWHGWDLKRRSLIALLIPLMVAAVVLLVMVKVLAFNREAEDELQRGLRALGQIHAVHAALAEAASGVRGFILTQDETFLAPYQRAAGLLKKSLSELETDLKDPTQRQSLSEISALVTVKLANLEKLQSSPLTESSGRVREYSLDNKLLLDQIRTRIAEMETRENQIIAALQQDLKQARQSSQRIIFSTLLAAVILAAILAQWFARDLIRRVRRIRDNAVNIGRGIPLRSFSGGYQDEVAELDSLVVQTGVILDQKLEELRCARELAEEANQAKTEFLSRTSHELRTPLNAILGFSELLQGTARSPENNRHITIIRRSAEHLLQLVNDLLDLSQLESGNMAIPLHPTSIHEAVFTARDIVSSRAQAKAVTLNVIDDGVVLAMANPQRLVQILINLMDNAIKFTPPATHVTVRWRIMNGKSAESVELIVTDSGPGITAGLEEGLFSPFNRLDSNREGVGLGLAISRSLAEQMGGRLDYRAAPGGGCDFVLWLLLDRRATESHKPSQQPHRATLSNQLQKTRHSPLPWILMVQDPEFLMLAETLAARFRAQCVVVSSQLDWRSISLTEPCFLLTDIPPQRLTLPENLMITKRLYITAEPPPHCDQKSILWLAAPITARRMRRLIQEMDYV